MTSKSRRSSKTLATLTTKTSAGSKNHRKSAKAKEEAAQESRRGRGRPPIYQATFPEQARKICELGATDMDIANFFGVTVTTIHAWKITHPEFSNALKRGKEAADDLVEHRLFARATGYSYDAVKIFASKDDKEPIYAPYVEHCPPDTTAAIFWLCNRRKDRWRQRQEHTGENGGPIQHNVGVAWMTEEQAKARGWA